MNVCSARFLRFVHRNPLGICPLHAVLPLVLAAFATLAVFRGTCYGQDKPDSVIASQIDHHFENSVRPLLVSKCFECHSSSTEQNGGLALDSLEAMLRGGDSGKALRIDSLDDSLIIRAVRYRDPKLQMPPDGKLSTAEIKTLEDWVAGGAKVSADFEKAPSNRSVKSSALSVQQAREHWAYRPISNPSVPESEESNPIDAWISQRATELGIVPSPLVDDRVWVRRLAIDLHGLNPTTELFAQADRVLNHTDPTLREQSRLQLVDEFLQSPRFGERFARHWMDVVRYAESLTLRGFVLPDVWRYRNYLIDAFNRDRPFDQIIIEQIAGDLLDGQTTDASSIQERQNRWIATTFWAIGDHNYEEQDKKQLEMDAVDEQLEVMGRAFLAQTLGCARCHDHKFDPIPTADYYALAGILKSSVSMEHENVSKWIRLALPLDPQQQKHFETIEEKLSTNKKLIANLKQQLKSGDANSMIVQSNRAQGIVVDDRNAKKIGSWKESSSVKSYVDDGYLHDENKDRGKKSVTFEPSSLETGSYTVRMSYAHGDNRSSKTQVRVFSADGDSLITVNQKSPPPEDGIWIHLGKYRFEKGGAAFVIVSNENADGHVIADAVQFVPENAGTEKETVGEKTKNDQQESLKQAITDAEKVQSELQKQYDLRPMVETIRAEKNPGDIPIHVRGSVHRLGDVVQRGFLSCINTHEPQLAELTRIDPASNGRLELAKWIASPRNPLTARVYVNRIWYHLLGQGIVPSLDNFGTTGQLPTHPELLDWLSSEFIAHGWSTKWLVRTIVTSKTYRRGVSATAQAMEKDPENTGFARGNLRRLDSEALRDSMLQSSGELRLGGTLESTIKSGTSADYRYQHENNIRSVYMPWFRNALPPMVREFDGANPSFSISQRNRSTVATQALAMMNNPWVRDRAKALVASLPQPPYDLADLQSKGFQIERIFQRILGRSPDEAELLWAEELLKTDDLEELAHQLFASIDFRYAP
jgi:PAS domain-containing protein